MVDLEPEVAICSLTGFLSWNMSNLDDAAKSKRNLFSRVVFNSKCFWDSCCIVLNYSHTGLLSSVALSSATSILLGISCSSRYPAISVQLASGLFLEGGSW